MDIICMTSASLVEGVIERSRTYIYQMDDDEASLRDNRRGKALIDLMRRNSPKLVYGRPPAEAHPIMSIYLGVMNTRHNRKSDHAMDYQRHDFSARYHAVCRKLMDDYNHIWNLIARAKRAEEKAK